VAVASAALAAAVVVGVNERDLGRAQSQWLRQTCASIAAREYPDQQSVPRSVERLPLSMFRVGSQRTSATILSESCV
jgi:plasmid replication initiation protein